MANCTKTKGKDLELVTTNGQVEEAVPERPQRKQEYMSSHFGKYKKKSCCKSLLKYVYTLLGVITVFKSIALIAVSITSAIAVKIYSDNLSGRLVSMVILAVTAAVTIAVVIYSIVAVFRKKKRPLHAAAIALMIVALIQVIIAAASVRITEDDEIQLTRWLTESFRLAREDSPRHIKLWSATQYDLNCCGVYSPEDYRVPNLPNYFSPDVPVSCCPSYNPARSELVQERLREVCKAKKEFYDVGCRGPVVDVFKDTSALVMYVTIGLIILEIVLGCIGIVLCKKKKMLGSSDEGEEESPKA